MANPDTIKQAQSALEQILKFNPESIARVEELGTELNFAASVPTAKRIVDFFNLIPVALIAELSETQASYVRACAESSLRAFKLALDFRATHGQGSYQTAVSQIESNWNECLDKLTPVVALNLVRLANPQQLECVIQDAVREIKGEHTETTAHIKTLRGEVDQALKDVRAAALEVGVTQQATHFSTTGTEHAKAATRWMITTVLLAVVLVALAIGSLFLHKWAFIKPADAFESIQLIAGKAIVFATFTYVLVLSAKNYLSHRHNAVLNQHRQNALMTYRALTEAANGKATGDIVLAHAASCIFSPQETGYTKPGAESTGPRGVLELLTKATSEKSAD